jgi:cellulose synthase/poly-beta-1,6-N-acetylglucosamine synthase-like glycosyltransferase
MFHVGSAELVVVDNGSTDPTWNIAETVARGNQSVVRVLRATTPGKNHAFEAGVRAARGDIVAIVDDDNYVLPGYLRHAADFFRDYPLAAVVGSSNRLDESINAPEWFGWAQDHLACARPVISENVVVDDHGREVGDMGYIAGAGMAFRKQPMIDAWDAGYRFFSNTDRQARVTGEDIELCFLLRSMGFRFGFDPRMQLRHDIAAARLTPAAFWDLCEMIGAGSIGIDPFCFTTTRDKPGLPWKWHWCWQLMPKLKRWARAGMIAPASGASRDEHQFRKRRERHQAWGALRYLFLNRSRYTAHVRQVASGPWTRLRTR